MNKPTNQGVSLIEALIASSIVVIVIGAVTTAYSLYLNQHFVSTSSVKGVMLLEEGMEAVRSMRDRSWVSSFGALSTNTTYYLVFDDTESQWEATTTPQWIDDTFKRSFTITEAYRDGNDDLQSSGTLDNNTKQVTVNVAWQTMFGTTSSEVTAYFTNMFEF